MKRKHTAQPAAGPGPSPAEVPAQPRSEKATLHQVKSGRTAGQRPGLPPRWGSENVFTFNFILWCWRPCGGSFDDMLFCSSPWYTPALASFSSSAQADRGQAQPAGCPRANVVREGNLISCPPPNWCGTTWRAGLRRPDPADATVFSGQVQVNEALITGEADAITKAPGDAVRRSWPAAGPLDRWGGVLRPLTWRPRRMSPWCRDDVLDKLIRIIGILLIPSGFLFVGDSSS